MAELLRSNSAYPIEYINNAKIPCMSSAQPTNIIYLTCDAFGVLPPVSLLNSEQAQYWFLSGEPLARVASDIQLTLLHTRIHLQDPWN